jgi:hypothetical protein
MFGPIYIGIPHGILLMILSIGLMFVRMVTFWAILFTGKYPKGLWDYQVNFMRYQMRVNARFANLADGYPAFGLNGTDPNMDFDIEYKEEVSRGTLLVRAMFGMIYVMIPHGIALLFRGIANMFVQMIGFWAILFTGKFPKGLFDFAVGTGRWGYRVQCYLNFYTEQYPAFSGKVLPGENTNLSDNSTMNNDMDVIDA